MWEPTHVQVTVQRAEGLLTKGKNNTNDCFITIALGKVKYQTSLKEKSPSNVEWHEECELPIPDHGNTAEIVLTALHRNFMGVDEFLGRVTIPLNSLDVYERPKNRWFPLQSKQGQENKSKERGNLEVKIGFTVKSGSLTDLSKKEKHKSSIGALSTVAQSVGGSLLSLGSAEKRKGIKKFAKSIGSKMHLRGKKKDGDNDDANSSIGSVGSLRKRNDSFNNFSSKQTKDDADPGVISEDDDEFTFDELSHKSSGSSLSQNNPQNLDPPVGDTFNKSATLPPMKPPRIDSKPDEWQSKLFGKQNKSSTLKPSSTESLNRRSWDSSKLESQIKEEELLEVKKVEPIINKSPVPIVKKEESGMFFNKLKKPKVTKDKVETVIVKPQKTERVVIGEENEAPVQKSKLSNEILSKFEGKSREEIILMCCNMQSDLDMQKKKLKDMQDYLDDLLLRVMDNTPGILQNPYVTCKFVHKNFS